jgi:hypothetical protein
VASEEEIIQVGEIEEADEADPKSAEAEIPGLV